MRELLVGCLHSVFGRSHNTHPARGDSDRASFCVFYRVQMLKCQRQKETDGQGPRIIENAQDPESDPTEWVLAWGPKLSNCWLQLPKELRPLNHEDYFTQAMPQPAPASQRWCAHQSGKEPGAPAPGRPACTAPQSLAFLGCCPNHIVLAGRKQEAVAPVSAGAEQSVQHLEASSAEC